MAGWSSVSRFTARCFSTQLAYEYSSKHVQRSQLNKYEVVVCLGNLARKKRKLNAFKGRSYIQYARQLTNSTHSVDIFSRGKFGILIILTFSAISMLNRD